MIRSGVLRYTILATVILQQDEEVDNYQHDFTISKILLKTF